jgi:NAD(P)-dependent dehydrogenase (short-subunit alcohol dehydrogenase family)
MNSLKGKIIVVTGGSGLIGRSIIKNIVSNGAIAINAEINVIDNLDEGIVNCDVTDVDSVKKCIEKVLEKYNVIDGWVNNAYPRTADWGTKFEDIPLTSWQKNVDLQLNSLFICAQEILRIMKNQQFGSIVNISSIYGTVGPDFTIYEGTNMTMPAAYSAIKGGIVNFTRYLASYYGPYGIRVNCVSPGGILDQQNDLFVKQYEKKVPMRRMGLPEDIAPSISFFLSDETKYITGQNLIIDGGWTSI